MLHQSVTLKGESSSEVVECVDSAQLLSSAERLISSIARHSPITFQAKSGGKRDLGHNGDGLGYRGAGECGRLSDEGVERERWAETKRNQTG